MNEWRLRRRTMLFGLVELNFNVIIFCATAFIAVLAVVVIFLKARK